MQSFLGLRSCLVLVCILLCAAFLTAEVSAKPNDGSVMPLNPEGTFSVCEIEAGPFDIHRKYKSMEGPYVIFDFKIGDLLAAKRLDVPESNVQYVEGKPEGGPAMNTPSMTEAPAENAVAANEPGKAREMLWFKGIKLEVIDENGQVMPTAEYVCHLNIDVDQNFRNEAFPTAEPCNVFRLISVTQGQTQMFFPAGYAVPVTNDEPWSIMFQAANRTGEQHRRIKHRCTMYFIKESDLVSPVQALHWFIPAGVVVVDKGTSESVEGTAEGNGCCIPTTMGVHAPNSNAAPVETDPIGRKITGHWAIPVGKSRYERPVKESVGSEFCEKDRKIHFVWTHVHPCCTTASLVDCDRHRNVFDIDVKTKTKGGLEILHIDTLSSKKGIDLPAQHNYEIVAHYDNTTGKPLDSMVSFGIFFADKKFARPEWCYAERNEKLFCGVPEQAMNDSPLLTAISEGSEDIAKKLVSKKDGLSSTNERKESALHYAAAVGSSIELVDLLVKGGLDINAVNYHGETPLMIAVNNKNREIALWLIGKGADVNICNADGSSPLLHAALTDDATIAVALINAGANVALVNRHGDSPLKLAQQHNNNSIMNAISAIERKIANTSRDRLGDHN